MLDAIVLLCEENGFTNVRAIHTKDIPFVPELRAACEQNYCGNYGKCWTCPPATPPVDEMEQRVKACYEGVVVQLIGAYEDSFDFESMQAHGESFKQKMNQTMDTLRDSGSYSGVWALSAGGCHICPACSYLENEPCRFPDKAMYSLEACGIVVNQMVEMAGLKYNNGENTVSYAGLILMPNR